MTHRILLVEDDEDISRMVFSYLVKEGYEVETAFDGEAAEKLFTAAPPMIWFCWI